MSDTMEADNLMEKMLVKYTNIKERMSGNQLQAFSRLSSNANRVQFALGKKNKLMEEFAEVTEDYKQKSDGIAMHLKEIGNEAFKKKQFRQALINYNAAVLYVKDPKVKSICLANRSAASVHLGHYEAAIFDIDAAVPHYQKGKLHTILDRKGKCQVQLKQYSKAAETFKLAREVVSAMDENTAMFWGPVIDKQIAECEQGRNAEESLKEVCYSALSEIAQGHDKKTKYVPIIKDPPSEHERVVSGLLEIAGDKVGDHSVVAKGEIGVGDIVMVESPFCAVLNPEYSATHCANCLKYVERQVACRNCTMVGYCSEECETEAWEDCHGTECPYQAWLDPQWVGRLGHLALRLTLRTLKNPENNLSHCVFHENGRDSDENFQLILLALHLLKILQNAHGNSRLDCGSNPDWSYVTAMLLHHLMVVQCNGFSVADMQAVNSFKHAKPIDIGLALYTNMAMINHSCSPNLEVGFHGSKAAVMATQNISAGQEVCVDYGVTFITVPKTDRQAMLKANFLFDCQCEACRNDWPMFDTVESKVPTFRCPTCSTALNMSKKVKCPKCKQTQNLLATVESLQDSHEAYTKAMEVAVTGDFLPVLPALLGHLSLMQKLIIPPWRDFLSCQSTIKQCYRLLPATLPH